MKLLLIIIGILIIGCNSSENRSVNISPNEIAQKEKKEIKRELQDGDLIFHTSQSNQSKAIKTYKSHFVSLIEENHSKDYLLKI